MTESDTPRLGLARWWIATFGVTILLSAFLLFQVQPVVSKAILPWFGGCPAVWTTCMLFFQTLLFGGYLYAHLLQRWLTPRHQVAVHLALVAVAMALLPVVPGIEWKPSPAANPTWQILFLLSGTVGLPYFVLSATSPLLQAWFSGAYPGRSPYRLYALSNAGSLAALLSYPFLFEPTFDLPSQSAMWSWAFVVYAGLCVVLLACVWQLRRQEPPSSSETGGQDGPSLDPRPNWSLRLRWLALPACASLLLLAATNHVCEDVAVVPFLWVMPLSIYLLSFIICFDHARWYIRPLWAALAVLALAGASVNDYLRIVRGGWSPLSLMAELQLYFTALFCACMVCHGELVRLKPAPKYLTEFYLLIAAGGALGGVFVAIVAPLAFNTYFEWPMGIAATFVLSVGLLILPGRKTLLAATLRAAASDRRDSASDRHSRTDAERRKTRVPTQSAGTRNTPLAGTLRRRIINNLALVADIIRRLKPSPFIARLLGFAGFGIAVAFALIYLAIWGRLLARSLDSSRNFFGVVAVVQPGDPPQPELQLRHGRIMHGCQSLDPAKRRWPTSYYGEDSGGGQAIRFFQKSGPVRVGLIGLGTGTLATYARPDDVFRFYEINPEVYRMASEYFTYLYDCRGKWKVKLGDARLSLDAEEPQNYDVLVVDAFSGDAIPTHLLTREAFEIYRRHLKPGGAIAVHVSNGYLRLAPVVRRLAEDCGMKTTRICSTDDESRLVDGSEWVVVTRNEVFLSTHPSQPCAPDDTLRVPLWTDQYSNLFLILAPRE